jgi:hypothetical protein
VFRCSNALPNVRPRSQQAAAVIELEPGLALPPLETALQNYQQIREGPNAV